MQANAGALRTILVGAFEEEALGWMLTVLVRDHGGRREDWFGVLQDLEAEGVLGAYRDGPPEKPTSLPARLALPAPNAPPFDRDGLHVCRTDRTLARLHALPHPAPDDPIRMTCLWPPAT